MHSSQPKVTAMPVLAVLATQCTTAATALRMGPRKKCKRHRTSGFLALALRICQSVAPFWRRRQRDLQTSFTTLISSLGVVGFGDLRRDTALCTRQSWVRQARWTSMRGRSGEAYAGRDLCSGDETGLFFQMLPAKTHVLKGDPCKGGKQSKLRVTVFLCTIVDGSDKCPAFVIWNPRCFQVLRCREA